MKLVNEYTGDFDYTMPSNIQSSTYVPVMRNLTSMTINDKVPKIEDIFNSIGDTIKSYICEILHTSVKVTVKYDSVNLLYITDVLVDNVFVSRTQWREVP